MTYSAYGAGQNGGNGTSTVGGGSGGGGQLSYASAIALSSVTGISGGFLYITVPASGVTTAACISSNNTCSATSNTRLAYARSGAAGSTGACTDCVTGVTQVNGAAGRASGSFGGGNGGSSPGNTYGASYQGALTTGAIGGPGGGTNGGATTGAAGVGVSGLAGGANGTSGSPNGGTLQIPARAAVAVTVLHQMCPTPATAAQGQQPRTSTQARRLAQRARQEAAANPILQTAAMAARRLAAAQAVQAGGHRLLEPLVPALLAQAAASFITSDSSTSCPLTTTRLLI